MTFNEYQETLGKFDVSNGEAWYYALGMGGETGEVLEKIKKFYRDGVLDPDALRYELGDVLWYLGRLASKLGIDLESVAAGNVEKLTARLNTGTLRGSGDTRHLHASTNGATAND